MRVHKLSFLRNDDDGAVAVVVALMSVVLIGISAFAVDFGAAYLAKRDTQNGVDASALAAGRELGSYTGSCGTVAGNAGAVSAAKTQADNFLGYNVKSSTGVAWSVGCSSDGKSIEVRYGADTKSDRALGGVFGGSGKYTVNREATATVGVATDAAGLRPYMICAADIPTLQQPGVQQLNFPNAACGAPSGNWYSIDCPEDGEKNSTKVLANNTQFGCDSDIGIIDTTAAKTPGEIVSTLIANCPGLKADPGCLTGNTGNLPDNNITKAFDAILGQQILLPVFFIDTSVSPPNTSVTGTGNNAKYPVYAFVGVTFCGYHFQNKSTENLTTAGACSGAKFTSPPGAKGNGEGYDAMLLKLTNVITSGSTKASTCKLGDTTCDFGARTVRLVQ